MKHRKYQQNDYRYSVFIGCFSTIYGRGMLLDNNWYNNDYWSFMADLPIVY